jgi:hypothetical protein
VLYFDAELPDVGVECLARAGIWGDSGAVATVDLTSVTEVVGFWAAAFFFVQVKERLATDISGVPFKNFAADCSTWSKWCLR